MSNKTWIEDTRDHPLIDINDKRHLINLENIKTIRTYEEKYGKKGSLQQLIDKVKKIDAEKALIKISIASTNLVKNNVPFDENRIITRNNLAYLAKIFAYYGSLAGGAEPQDEKMSELCLIYNSLCSDNIDFEEEDIPTKLGEYFIRNVELTGEGCNLKYDLPRAIILYSEIAELEEYRKNFDIKKRFQEITGLDIKEYIYSGLGFASVFQHGYAKTKASIEGEAHDKVLPYLLKFLEYNSVDISVFREENEDAEINNLYSFNPLEQYPILEIKSGDFVCPIFPFLNAKITNGIYYILFDKHKEEFSNLFGKIFEEYVGGILSPYFDDKALFPEKEYTHSGKNNLKSSDWSIKEGHWVTLLECKTKRFRQKQTKQTGKLCYLDEDLSKGIVKGLKQVNRVINDIEIKKELFPEFEDVNRYIPIIVLLDRCYLGNSAMVKRRINELLYSEGISLEMPYHVIDIMELEALLPVVFRSKKKRNFRKFIQQKELSGRYKYESFWNHLCYEYPEGIKINPKLKERFDSIWKEAISFIFQKDIKKIILPQDK